MNVEFDPKCDKCDAPITTVLKVIGGYKPFVEWEPAATDPDAP